MACDWLDVAVMIIRFIFDLWTSEHQTLCVHYTTLTMAGNLFSFSAKQIKNCFSRKKIYYFSFFYIHSTRRHRRSFGCHKNDLGKNLRFYLLCVRAEHFRDLFLIRLLFISVCSCVRFTLRSTECSSLACTRRTIHVELLRYIAGNECLCVLCVNFLGFIFIYLTQLTIENIFVWMVGTLLRVDRARHANFIFIHKSALNSIRLRHTRLARYKFYYCRAVGLITRL